VLLYFFSRTVATFQSLFELARSDERTSYFLPEFASKLDPHGQLVPNFVAARVADVLVSPDVTAITELNTFAGWYGFNSVSWRTIAIAALQRLDETWSEEDRQAIYASLRSHRMHSWSGSFRDYRRSLLEADRVDLNAESVNELKAYWLARIEDGEEALRHAEARAEEGRD
jgi:hypothetical protein